MNRRNHIALRCIATALFVSGLIVSQIVWAQVTLNFVNADIDQVAKAIGAATGKTIIVDPRVKGQLNLVSENPVLEEQALKILQSALRMQGFSLLQDHGVLKVVPEVDAKLQGVPTYIGNTLIARGDQVITQVFKLKNESANNLLPVLRTLISPNNTITAYPANNTLVVTDYADNVRRLATIIAGIDIAASQKIALYPMKNANALDAAQQLSKMLDPSVIGSTDATLKVLVTADPRTNSLLLRASNVQRLKMAKALAKQLDAPTNQLGNIHVVMLRNADAVRLAKTLYGMLGKHTTGSGINSAYNQDTSRGSFSHSTRTSGLPPLPPGLPSSSFSHSTSLTNAASSFNSNNIASFFSDNENSGQEENQLGSMIQADAATNSLIITASEPAYRNLRAVIDQLDARRAQVYIEALIVELNANTVANLGIQWQGALLASNNGFFYGGSNFGSGNSNIVELAARGAAIIDNTKLLPSASNLLPNGLNIGLLHRSGGVFGLSSLLNAFAASSDSNVLSTPNLITLDNEEAKIVVGQNVPVVTGSYATPSASKGTSVTAFNTFDRINVGVTLHVKPQITEGGILKLQLYQEASTVDLTTVNNPGGVTIKKRSIQSTVLCDDGEIIVLGGLMQDNYSNGNNKIPLLGDIPWIGQLFRSENKMRSKSNLMVFLRPVIVRDEVTSSAIALNRYNYLRAQQEVFQSDNRIMHDQNIPILPPAPLKLSGSNKISTQNLFDFNRMTRESISKDNTLSDGLGSIQLDMPAYNVRQSNMTGIVHGANKEEE